MVQVFAINDVNLLMVYKIGGARIIMDLIILHTKSNNIVDRLVWRENVLFVNDALLALATCLRLSATAMRFIKDEKRYIK